MIDFVTVVSGLARCGSSATMQALVAGGLDPGVALWPYFEDVRQTRGGAPGWMDEYIGKAIKWLDPSDYPLPDGHPPCRTIWLDRDPKQQARSTVKFVKHNSERIAREKGIDIGDHIAGRPVHERMRQLKHRRPVALARMQRAGPLLVVRFESIVGPRKREAMQKIADFLEPHELDVDLMCKVVLTRSAQCSPVMLEDILYKKGAPPTGSPR